MRKSATTLLLPLLLACSFAFAAARQAPDSAPPAWAFPMPDKTPVAHIDDAPLKQVPGSTQTYDHPEIDPLDPPDWFPSEHPPMPAIVRHGTANPVQACPYCHLASGMGHPQSANLAGLPVQYFLDQIADFKSGARKAPPMDGIAKGLSDEDAKAAAEWFASLKPSPWVKVMETDTAPKTLVIIVRQLYNIQTGARNGAGVEPMKQVVANLTEQDMIAIAAYVSSREP